MSEDLFRVCVVRPPLAPNPRYPPIPLAQQSAFQVELGRAVSTNPDDPREGLEAASARYVSSPDFAGPSEEEPNNVKLDKVGDALALLYDPPVEEGDGTDPPNENEPNTGDENVATPESTAKAVKEILGDDIAANFTWTEPLEKRLKDSIIALRLLGIEQDTGNLALLTRRLRTIEVLKKIVNDPNFPFNDDDLEKYFLRPLLAPTFAELKSAFSTYKDRIKRMTDSIAIRNAVKLKVKDLITKRVRITDTLKNVARLPDTFQRTIDPKPFEIVPPKVDMSHMALASEHLKLVQNLASLTLKSFTNNLDGVRPRLDTRTAAQFSQTEQGSQAGPEARAVLEDNVASFSAIANPLVNMSNTLLASMKQIPAQPPQTPSFTVEKLKPFSLIPNALQQLKPDDMSVLKELELDITERPVDSSLNFMQRQVSNISQEIDSLLQPFTTRVAKVQNVGGTKVVYKKPLQSWNDRFGSITNLADRLDDLIDFPKYKFPKLPGNVRILGVADLIVVKQQLIRYEGGDVAYIENVLKGETRSREVGTLTSRESEITTEVETNESTETETTTAERFEVSNESDKTIKEESSVKAGVTVSASYGPTVSVSASANFSNDRSKSEAIKEASRYAKDVTTKATEKIAKRVLQRTVTKTRTETTTKDVHALNNTGTGHIAGVYQWLNKVYEAQMWNYGKRTMLDFMVPEPGAFYLDKQTDPDGPADSLVHVYPFQDPPNLIYPDNYVRLGVEYGITDLEAPPSEMSRTTASYAAGKDQPHSSAGKMNIPPGYEVVGISVTASGVADVNTQQNWVLVTCGSFQWPWNPQVSPVGYVTTTSKFLGITVDKNTTTIFGQTDTGGVEAAGIEDIQHQQIEISWAVTASHMESFCVTIEVLLKRTEEAMVAWQSKTWSRIKTASDNLIKAQKEAVEKAKFNSAFQGRNPEKNKNIMRDEMKKNCISILTDSHFDEFIAVVEAKTKAKPGDLVMSEIDLDRAEEQGAYVRFFEQAFEWTEMTWVLYPYFWGRKDHWYRRVDYEDEDPEFEKFIQSGFARVNVPVRPGFEGALEHFLSTGQIWMGGPLPGVTSSMFLPISVEIQESLGKKANEPVKYGDPWEVKVPTNLIRLRHDDLTPRWEKDKETQNWVEVPDAA